MPAKGRAASGNHAGRFERLSATPFDDGWGTLDEVAEETATKAANATVFYRDASKSILTRNQSPDIPFDRSINPYQGCEHGCIYCYARPSHHYWGLSSGLDFERSIFVKDNAAALLRETLAKPGYRPAVISLGANTDPYQPIERRLEITRSLLKVLAECRHPVGIVTKSAAVLRDLDLLREMAADRLVHVYLSVTTLDRELARRMEPRASTPQKRLAAVEALAAAGVTVGVNVSPIIPGLTDHEIEKLVAAAADAGAAQANSIMVRLPHDVKDLFEAWLEEHYPDRARHVLSLIEQSRGGSLNDPRFHSRMRGEGVFADLIAQRFQKARRRHGLDKRMLPMRTDLFRPPRVDGQMDLFAQM